MTEKISMRHTLTHQKPLMDAWVDLFESEASPLALLNLLGGGIIPAENPKVAARLRDAFVRRMVRAPIPQPSRQSTTVNVYSDAFPGTLTSSWPQMDMENEKTRSYDAGAHLLGRLIVAAGGIGQDSPDALDIALKATWTPVVRQILTHFTPPATQLDSRQSDSPYRFSSQQRYPWLHVLTHDKRMMELKDWLAIPGIQPNITCEQGTTALFHARSVDILDVLIKGGVDPSIQAHNGTTAVAEWEKRLGHYSLTLEVLQSMNKRLDQTFTHPQKKMESEVFRCLTQWLKPNHYFDTTESGPSLKTLSPELVQAIGNTRFQVTQAKHTQEWGPIAYIGLHLPHLQHNPTSLVKEGDVILGEWHLFINEIPEKWLTHESVPGVADGWVLAAGFLNQAVAYGKDSKSDALKLFTKLKERLLEVATSENKTGYCLDSIIGVYDALLIRTENTQTRNTLKKVLRNMASMENNPSMEALWGSYYETKIAESISECFVKGVFLSEAGDCLLSSPTLLRFVTPLLKNFLTEKDTQQRFWDILLRLYSNILGSEPKKELEPDTVGFRLALNRTLDTLRTEGMMPEHFKNPHTQQAIKISLPYILSPALATDLNAKLLDMTLPEINESSQMRIRL